MIMWLVLGHELRPQRHILWKVKSSGTRSRTALQINYRYPGSEAVKAQAVQVYPVRSQILWEDASAFLYLISDMLQLKMAVACVP